MKASSAIIACICFVLACCTPPAPEPTPPPAATAPAPAPAPIPAPMTTRPAYDNWLDAPQTPGNWTYRDGSGFSFATFGEAGQAAVFGVECMKRQRTVRLVRGARSNIGIPTRIRTETADRMLTVTPASDGRPMLTVTLPAADSLLDAMALSRGRFAVEAGGLPALYLPAWPEVTRVVEDCR